VIDWLISASQAGCLLYVYIRKLDWLTQYENSHNMMNKHLDRIEH
jgi:hypothetical protein